MCIRDRLSVGRNCAPLGADVITAVSATFPVNPPLGVTVIVDVLAVVAPGVTLTADPLTVKPVSYTHLASSWPMVRLVV